MEVPDSEADTILIDCLLNCPAV